MVSLLNRSQNQSASAKLYRMPWLVLVVAAFLVSAGAGALYSVAGGSYEPWAVVHVSRFLALTAIVLIIVVVPLRFWIKISYPAYAAALLLLAIVPYAGVDAMGARRWLSVTGLQFQPSEFMKLALVVALARFFQMTPNSQTSSPLRVAAALTMIAIPVLCTLRQPDLGSAILLLVLGMALLYLAGVSHIYFAAGAIAAAAAIPFILAGLHDYQRRRLTTFLDPEADPQGAGYHILQSKIALGSGGISGRGFMQGTQSQLDFLPEKHTDFVFTMLGEEWGYVGSLALLAAYAVLLLLLARMALQAATTYGRLVISGSLMTIFLYVFINVAMVTGLIPVVGIPLPLVSYGGTSMTTIMISLGLALSAHVHGHEDIGRARLGRRV